MNAQTYLDFATPARAAGAVQNKRGEWHLAQDPKYAYCAAQFLDEFNLEPLRVDPPKTRTMAAIRKAYGNGPECRTPGDKDWQAMRALQYAFAMRGEETKYQEFRYRAERDVQFDKAPDGSRRVRSVKLDSAGWQEIPHWDFVATVEETTLQEIAA